MKTFIPSMEACEVAERIKNSDTWDQDDCAELCRLAGLSSEWEAADGETFESVIDKACDILHVTIYEEKRGTV